MTITENLTKTVTDIHHRLETFKTTKKLPTIQDLQDLALAVWDVNMKSTDVTGLSAEEANRLRPALTSIFDSFSRLLEGVWGIDQDLVEPYDKLVNIRNALENLRRRKVYSNAELMRLQEALNEVESTYVKNGVFTGGPSVSNELPTANSGPKMGQAYLFSLLFHCYRVSRQLLEANDPVNAFLSPFYQQAQRIMDDLAKLGASSSPVQLKDIQLIQDRLMAIEAHKHNGVFVPNDWNGETETIPEGQAELNFLLEKAHDEVYHLLCYKVAEEKIQETESVADKMSTQIESWKEKTKGAAHEAQASTADFQKYLMSVANEFKSRAVEMTQQAKAHIGYAVSRGYKTLNDYLSTSLAVREMLDPKLADTQFELSNIRDGLKKMRNEILLWSLSEKNPTLKKEYQQRLSKFRERLVSVESHKQDGRFVGDDGSFAPQGQALLTGIMEECYAMCYEMEGQL